MLDSGKLIKPVPAKKMTRIYNLPTPRLSDPKKCEGEVIEIPDSFIKLSAKISPATSQDIKGRETMATSSIMEVLSSNIYIQ